MRTALQFLPKPKAKIKEGLYKHYKGNLYFVLYTGKSSDSLEDMVVYQATYKSREYGDYAIWTRKLSEFMEDVIIEDKKIQRFVKLSDKETINFTNALLK